jgi:hypothetical protein
MNLSRRTLLKATAATAATLAAQTASAQTRNSTPETRNSKTIGVQLDAHSLLAPDLNPLLDTLQSKAGVNALMPFVYSYVPEQAGLPPANFRGGNYATPHMKFYKGIPLAYDDMRAPEFPNVDLFANAIPQAKKRGIKTFAWILENNRRLTMPAWQPFYEIDLHGRRTNSHPSGPCYNNPLYQNFTLALVEDYISSYDIDGIMWSSERQGGLFNALGAWHHGDRADPGGATCFCEFCLARAKAANIDANRAKQGFLALETFVKAGRARQKPRDGYFVSFFRLLLNYPELLAWESLWINSRFDFMAAIYKKTKSLKQIPVGWHLWHNISFSPLHRAEMDYAKLAPISDYIKPVLYANCAGERMHSFSDSVSENIFGDLSPADTNAVLYKMLDYPNEAPYNQVTAAGFSADYVQRETRRCVDDVAAVKENPNKTEVWPGLDIDVPTPAGAAKTTPESVKASVLAAFKGGAGGIVLSRNFSEMNPAHLAGAADALKELGYL